MDYESIHRLGISTRTMASSASLRDLLEGLQVLMARGSALVRDGLEGEETSRSRGRRELQMRKSVRLG